MNPLTSSGSDTCFVSHTWISDGLSCCIHSFTVSGGFWHQLRDMLNPSASGAQPWHYYTINAVLIFIFNILDIVGLHSFLCNPLVASLASLCSSMF
jgi:hypothetical protein